MIAHRCDEHPPTPLWRELLALVPVVVPIVVEQAISEARARWGHRDPKPENVREP